MQRFTFPSLNFSRGGIVKRFIIPGGGKVKRFTIPGGGKSKTFYFSLPVLLFPLCKPIYIPPSLKKSNFNLFLQIYFAQKQYN